MELELLRKYFENKCTPEEAWQVLQWIEKSDASMDLGEDFNMAWQKIKVKPGDYKKWSGKLEKVHEQIDMEVLYESLNTDMKKNKIEYIEKDRVPKSTRESLEYSEKRKMRYIIPGLFAAVIIVFLIVVYFQFPEKVEQTPTIVQLEKSTEPGQKLSFHLDDGTRVVLNSGSKLYYPTSFDSYERKVILEGEAFFEVSKDINKPFRVVTQSVVTTALGTSFNINAFPGKENIEIALVTGKISVEKTLQSGKTNALILHPGEGATILKSDHTFSKSPFCFNQKIGWKDGLICFQDADYHEMIRKLECWYGVSFQSNKTPAKEWKFSGKFENETLDNIMIALQFGHDFDYELLGKDVKLKF